MNISVGLDIGWKDIKAIELSDGFKVTKFGKVKVPAGSIFDLDIHNHFTFSKK
jgi:Tfp pilus assembly PilM family ATPase